MRFKIAPEIVRNFPGLRIGLVMARNIDNTHHNETVHAVLRHQQKEIKDKLTLETLNTHPYIHAWHEAYKKFGASPKKYLSSIENLATRILKNSELKVISPLVDIYNSISLKYLLPVGGEDLDTVIGDIELTFAGDDERPVRLLGEKELYTPEPGEVIYKDQQGALCRRWNWKEADRTKLTPQTHNAILVIEALAPVDDAVLHDAVNELGYLIESYCGGITTVAILDEQHPEVILKSSGEYQPLDDKKPLSGRAHNIYSQTSTPQQTDEKKELLREHEVRVQKVEELRASGINPWPSLTAHEAIENTCQQIIEEFRDDGVERVYKIGGRVMTKREHGKAMFADIQDRTGTVQIYLKINEIGQEKFAFFKDFIDSGDHIYCTGTSFRTKMGQITLDVRDFRLVSKCLQPLPEKFHGIADIEIKYRRRYLDLMMNTESRRKFIARTQIIKVMRSFFDEHDFVEVETPILHPIPGGAAARPFVTHFNALDSDFYLRIAPELYLKRLVVGGFERVYEIGRIFRNEGLSTRHNPEFTMVELYMAHHDYHYIMDFVENLLRTIAQTIYPSLQIPYGDLVLDFASPFARISMRDAVLDYGNLVEDDIAPANIDHTLKKYNITMLDKQASTGQKLFALFEEVVESKLKQPTFIIDYPIETSPLSKRDPERPDVAARFELFVGGMELSNGFNELNDPFDQAERFKEQARARESGDIEAMYYDADYVQALQYGLPPTVGVGIGIDRVVMILTDTPSIRDVILFPALRKKEVS